MNEKIALYSKTNGELADFLHCDQIRIYQRLVAWQQVDTVLLDPRVPESMAEFRDKIRAVTDRLTDCKIIAGGELSGLPYSVFDRMGFHIFELADYSDKVFDQILKDIERGDEAQRMKREIIESARPVETSTPGIYYLDLIALQTECPEVSSKKALIGFLRETPFSELRLRCKHIPPWLEHGPYHVSVEKEAQRFISAVITKKSCEEGDLYETK